MARSTLITALQLSIRSAVAAGLAVAVAQFLRFKFPIYALVSAVIVTDLSASRTRELALPRLVGTVLGATLGAVINPFARPGPWAVGLSVLAAMGLSHLLRLPDTAKLAGYVSGIVVLNHGDHPWFYALHRVLETGVGIALALLVALVPKLISVDRSTRQDS